MEENTVKFEEKLKELVALGKKRKVFWRFRRSMTFLRIWNWKQNRWKRYLNIWKPTILMCCVSAVTMIWT